MPINPRSGVLQLLQSSPRSVAPQRAANARAHWAARRCPQHYPNTLGHLVPQRQHPKVTYRPVASCCNGSLSGQISRSGEARGSADVGGAPLSMFDGSIDSPRATRADYGSGLISRLPLLSASASKCEKAPSLVKLIEPASNQTVEIGALSLAFSLFGREVLAAMRWHRPPTQRRNRPSELRHAHRIGA